MISYRIFLFGFLSVSWLFLSGFDNPVATDTPINQAQKVPVEADSVAIKSLPQDEADQLNSFFESRPKKQQRSLELNGNFLMSPEPEAERRKTVDGAGISINVKPD